MQIVILTTLLATILEVNLISLPLTFVVLLFWAITRQENTIFPLAFFSGLLLDLITFRELGISSACFLVLLIGVFLYRSKFEIRTLQFFTASTFSGSLIYLVISGSGHVFLGAITTAFVSALSFRIFEQQNHKLKLA